MKTIGMIFCILLLLFAGAFFFGIPIVPQSLAATNVTAIPLQGVIPKNGVNVPVLSILIKTDENPLNIQEIHIRRTGLSSHTDIEGLRAQTRNLRSRRTPMLSDDIARIRFNPTIEIPENTREQIVITANFQFKESQKTLGFVLEDILTTEPSSEFTITQKQRGKKRSRRTTTRRYTNHQRIFQAKSKQSPYRSYRYRGSHRSRIFQK